MYVFDV
jgi:adenosine kinase